MFMVSVDMLDILKLLPELDESLSSSLLCFFLTFVSVFLDFVGAGRDPSESSEFTFLAFLSFVFLDVAN